MQANAVSYILIGFYYKVFSEEALSNILTDDVEKTEESRGRRRPGMMGKDRVLREFRQILPGPDTFVKSSSIESVGENIECLRFNIQKLDKEKKICTISQNVLKVYYRQEENGESRIYKIVTCLDEERQFTQKIDEGRFSSVRKLLRSKPKETISDGLIL